MSETIIPGTGSTVGARPRRSVLRAAMSRAGSMIDMPVALVVGSLFLSRPNVGGESFAPIGFLLIVLAAAIAVSRRPDAGRHSGAVVPQQSSGAVVVVPICLGLAYLWMVLRAAAISPFLEVKSALQDSIMVIGSLVALVALCRDVSMRIRLGRAVVYTLAVLCASYLVTTLIWLVAGTGAGQVFLMPVGGLDPQPVYFPFTVTASTQDVLGITFPRFTGLGREPGWMAMYCAAGFFLCDLTMLRRRWVKGLLVLGLLGTVSTAGFGVFVVVWTYQKFLRARGGVNLGTYFRQLLGVVAILGALWLATDAPVLGLSAKSTQNNVSLERRQLATDAGIRALTDSPLGGVPTEEQAGVNLISDIAVDGLPFVLLATAALLLPMALQRSRGHGNAIPFAVFLTLLLSQPAPASTWAFGIVLLAYALQNLTEEQREAFRWNHDAPGEARGRPITPVPPIPPIPPQRSLPADPA